MTGIIALDVVIGLVFIYLLYSLFATVIMEILNTFLGLRARNLRYALRRMLMDEENLPKVKEYVEKSSWMSKAKNEVNTVLKAIMKIINTFIKISGRSGNLSDPGLFHKFYEQPSIKYLSGGGIANKPSYIAAHNFSKTILDAIKLNYNSDDVIKRIEEELETLKSAFAKLEDSSQIKIDYTNRENQQQDFEQWFTERSPLKKIKYAAYLLPETKKITPYLQSIEKLAGDDPDQTKEYLAQSLEGKSIIEKIKAGIDALPEGSDTKKHLESLMADANDNLQKFNSFLEQWFNDTMERATGWYKRRIQYFLLIIGFVLAVSFNANTIDIVKRLSDDPDARSQMVELAIEYSKENKSPRPAEVDAPVADTKKDTTQANAEDNFRKANDSLHEVAAMIRADIEEAQNIITTNWYIPDSIKITKITSYDEGLKSTKGKDSTTHVFQTRIKEKGKKKEDYSLAYVSVKVHNSVDIWAFKKAILPITQKALNKGYTKVKTGKYKRKFVFKRDGWRFNNLWGYILTALAISMGSPFWFDLLNRLIKLRSTIKPRTDSSDTNTENK